MIATAPGLNYGLFADLLREQGFYETVDARGRTFEHASGARLRLPPLKDEEPLRLYHLVAARGMLRDYGLLEPHLFDMNTIRLSQKAGVTD